MGAGVSAQFAGGLPGAASVPRRARAAGPQRPVRVAAFGAVLTLAGTW